MDPEKNQNLTQPQKSTSKTNAKPMIIGLLVLLLIVVGVYAFVSKDKKNDNSVTQNTFTETTVDKTAELSADPATATTQNGQVVTFSIWVDTGGQKISALQANLTYPTDQYDFVNIDTTGSAFEIQAESKGGDGKIAIARGQIGGITGKQLVAKVNLKAKTQNGQGSLAFAEGSKVVTFSENPEQLPEDILNKTSGATLTIGE